MRAGSVVVVDVRGQDTAKIALVEDEDVIETFAADQTDDPLDVGVLPGRARCGNDLCDPRRLDRLASAGRCVTIAQQIIRSRVPRERSVTEQRETRHRAGPHSRGVAPHIGHRFIPSLGRLISSFSFESESHYWFSSRMHDAIIAASISLGVQSGCR